MTDDNRPTPVKGRALVVDDEEAVRQVLTILLEQEGYEPQAVATLEEARAAVAQQKPDLLILDITLGALSGAELLAELAREDNAPVTVIVSGTVSSFELALRYGVPLVRKPFDVDALMDVVDGARARGSRPVLRRIAAA
ncbi:MAG: response regulator [Polyangiales bacterium]